jgi:hypothetical protein
MNKSINEPELPAQLLNQMQEAAKHKFKNLRGWAKVSGVPQETLSRLKVKTSCDLRTLNALAQAAGYKIAVIPKTTDNGSHFPQELSRDMEMDLLELAASGNTEVDAWKHRGPSFFLGGLAVLLASGRGFDREKYMRLAEELHPGISNHEVFAKWLESSPIRAARFLPMARKRKGLQ